MYNCIMFCHKCGNELNDEMDFCPKCGKKVIAPKRDNRTMSLPKPKKESRDVNETVYDITKFLYVKRKFIILALFLMVPLSLFFTFINFGGIFDWNGFDIIEILFRNIENDNVMNMSVWFALAGVVYLFYLTSFLYVLQITLRSFWSKRPLRTNHAAYTAAINILISTVFIIISYYQIRSDVGEPVNRMLSSQWGFLLGMAVILMAVTSFFKFSPLNDDRPLLPMKERLKVIATFGVYYFTYVRHLPTPEQEKEQLAHFETPMYAMEQLVEAINENNLFKAASMLIYSKPICDKTTDLEKSMFEKAVTGVSDVKIISYTKLVKEDKVALYEYTFEFTKGDQVQTQTISVYFEQNGERLCFIKCWDYLVPIWTVHHTFGFNNPHKITHDENTQSLFFDDGHKKIPFKKY